MFAEELFGVGVGMSLMTLAYNYPPALWGDGEVASPPRKRCGDAPGGGSRPEKFLQNFVWGKKKIVWGHIW